jgi:hypothetical protein
MIPINELRINSLVYYNNKHNEIGIITEIKTSLIPKIDYVGINNRIDIYYQTKHINPIPLTEEWLLNLGFKLKGFYRLQVTSFLELCWKPHDKTLNLQTEKNGFTEDSKVKYVHELQNLYFALTGTELTLIK